MNSPNVRKRAALGSEGEKVLINSINIDNVIDSDVLDNEKELFIVKSEENLLNKTWQ